MRPPPPTSSLVFGPRCLPRYAPPLRSTALLRLGPAGTSVCQRSPPCGSPYSAKDLPDRPWSGVHRSAVHPCARTATLDQKCRLLGSFLILALRAHPAGGSRTATPFLSASLPGARVRLRARCGIPAPTLESTQNLSLSRCASAEPAPAGVRLGSRNPHRQTSYSSGAPAPTRLALPILNRRRRARQERHRRS